MLGPVYDSLLTAKPRQDLRLFLIWYEAGQFLRGFA
jgi:hypothetical protein